MASVPVQYTHELHSFASYIVFVFLNCRWPEFTVQKLGIFLIHHLGDLKTRKSTGTTCQIEIHFSSQTSKFLIKYNLLRFQISSGLIIFFTEHDYKVSTSFIKESKRYK